MIHREGIKISAIIFVVLLVLNMIVFLLAGTALLFWILLPASLLFMLFILRFFRNPHRAASFSPGVVYSPADGKVVVVEETNEEEYLGDRRIQISIFMSVWNVHINWFPVSGLISYYKYHPGKFLLARHPKSSTDNERNTVVVKNERDIEILIRQIAGAVARRIISYAETGKKVKEADEMGFIRFGSRVDVFLPLNSKILVRPGQRVRGLDTPIAEIES
ncbi:MAG TPA: phosphatidylserine decarboxylase family protein [Bacteroides sp.]|nr:phosphatidylserine decarboxylase family protein [Bacteroides sp.]